MEKQNNLNGKRLFGEERERYLTLQNCATVLILQKEVIATTK
jgi:hypothetical protein